jgi:hypothetical protein
VGPGFDEGEVGERFFGKELLVTETEKPLVDPIGFETEVSSMEFLVEARVTHAGIDENAFPGEDGEEVCI